MRLSVSSCRTTRQRCAPRASRTGHLSCPDRDPRQQEVHRVDARNQEQKAGRPKQDRDRRAQISNHVVQKGLGDIDQRHLRDRVGLQFLRALGELALELIVGAASSQANEPSIAADVVVGRRQPHQVPIAWLFRELELLGCHTNHRSRYAFCFDDLSDDVRVGREQVAPCRMGDDERPGRLAALESPAERHLRAEHFKELVGDAVACRRVWPAVGSDDVDLLTPGEGCCLHQGVFLVLLEWGKIPGRHVAGRRPVRGHRAHQVDLSRVRVGKVPQEYRIHHGEYRDAPADPKAEGDQHRDGEPWLPSNGAHRELQVAPHERAPRGVRTPVVLWLGNGLYRDEDDRKY